MGLSAAGVLLDEYMKLYPSCLEIVLISARIRMTDFEGFEEAKWPVETPGIHCIWNQYQYIECALQKGGPDIAKEVQHLFQRYRILQKKSNVIGINSSHAYHWKRLQHQIQTC